MSAVDTAYILSSGHSGSTLLNLLLGGHPSAIPVGEVTHLPKNLALNTTCSCGSPVRSCGFWTPIISGMSQRLDANLGTDPYALNLGFISATKVVDHEVMTRTYRRIWRLRQAVAYARVRMGSASLPMLRKFDEGVRNTSDLFDLIRSVSGARIVIDASKDYLKGLTLYRFRPAGTRLILLTRDGRGVFYSGLRSGLPRHKALRRWRNYYLNALPLIAHAVPVDHILTIRYEDIATDTERTLRTACSFLHLDFDARMLALGSKPVHIANGNGLRLRGDRVVALDHAWRTALTPADRAYFDRHAGALNARLGYQDATAGADPSVRSATLTE